jgi:hypothetical protein
MEMMGKEDRNEGAKSQVMENEDERGILVGGLEVVRGDRREWAPHGEMGRSGVERRLQQNQGNMEWDREKGVGSVRVVLGSG